MKLFSWNPETLALCCDVIIAKLRQICISCRTGGKSIKTRNYNNFGSNIFFCRKNFFQDFQNLWHLYLEVNIFASKFQLIVSFIILSPFVRHVQIRTLLDQICGWWRHKEEGRYGETSGFCNATKLIWEMNCSPQTLNGCLYWSFYYYWFIMYKFRPFLNPIFP